MVNSSQVIVVLKFQFSKCFKITSANPSIRNWINSTIKAKAKASKKKGKKGTAAAAQDEEPVGDDGSVPKPSANAEYFAQLGVEMPASAEEQVEMLKGLLEEDAKMDSCIENAKKSVVKASMVPVTKLATEEERNSKNQRTKVMQEALEAANSFQKGDATSGAKSGNGASSTGPSFGFQAALAHAQATGGRPIQKKKANKTDEAKVVANLGKHLLK